MAKMMGGYMGGFRGRLGTAVGYMWNGKWCLRSRPGAVRNPRTEEQTRHRAMFREEVRQASYMWRAAEVGLTATAREMGMTCYNLFVSANQSAFGWDDGTLTVDYSRLAVGMGPVAPVGFDEVLMEEGNVLKVRFERNPMRTVAGNYDRVMLYVYCPAAKEGIISAPVYRMDRRIGLCLPDEYMGCEVHVYGMVQDDEGRAADSCYLGCFTVGEFGNGERRTENGELRVENALPLDNLAVGGAAEGYGAEQVESGGEVREVDAAGGGGGHAAAGGVEHG